MEFGRDLIGKCGICCEACRLFLLKKREGCSNEEAKCPYKRAKDKAISSCGECQEFKDFIMLTA